MLEAVAAFSLYIGSAVVTASATIIALMLTMIGLTRKAHDKFQAVFMVSVKRIAQISSIALITGILLLLFLSVPLQQSDQVPGSYFKVVYYILVSTNALVSGLLAAIVLMLLNAINSLIEVIHPFAETEYSKEEQEDEA